MNSRGGVIGKLPEGYQLFGKHTVTTKLPPLCAQAKAMDVTTSGTEGIKAKLQK